MLIYYLRGEAIEGPFSLEELRRKKIAPETMIWFKHSPQWKRLDEVPEVYAQLVGANGVLVHESVPDQLSHLVKRFRWLLIWVGFNFLALVLSLWHVKPFNYLGDPQPGRFWPFVKFTDATYTKLSSNPDTFGTLVKFNGIFANYDWTEFSVYVGGTIFIYLLYYLHKKSA